LLGVKTKETVARSAKSAKNDKDACDGNGDKTREVVARRSHGRLDCDYGADAFEGAECWCEEKRSWLIMLAATHLKV
jgi:hypothetical protein